jgi:hypothetical protein
VRLFDELTNKNFELYAARHYRNNQCLDVKEFYDDILRFLYLHRLLRKYKEGGDINIRLVLNHIITIYNVFGIQAANRMILFKIDDDLHPVLKTFLAFLNYLPENTLNNISIDLQIAKELQGI